MQRGENAKIALCGAICGGKEGSEGKMSLDQKVLSRRDLQHCRRPQSASSQSKNREFENFLSLGLPKEKFQKSRLSPILKGKESVPGHGVFGKKSYLFAYFRLVQ